MKDQQSMEGTCVEIREGAKVEDGPGEGAGWTMWVTREEHQADEQQVQRAWAGSMPSLCEEQQRNQCGWSESLGIQSHG